MTSSARALAFFDEARAGFPGERIAHYQLAGRTVRIATGDGFDFVHRAFAHLRVDAPSGHDLEICVWQKSGMPAPPWRTDDYGPRGEIRGFNDPRFSTAFDHLASSLSMFDRERHRAIFWTRDASALPQSEHGAPLKTILHWWLEMRGDLFVHAAAIGNDSGAVLLAGEGGAGKSTTAILCARNGLTYLADDYCAVEMSAPPRVHSLYGTGKLVRENSRDEKELLYPEMKRAAPLPLRAIFVPLICSSAKETTIEPTNASAAFKALVPSTISQLPGAGAQTFQRLAQLAQALPCFQLNLARDFDRIGQVVRDFLER
ncbi:MAG: hypothetical protein M3Y86_11860 [Verrucomicrobiota bacterium]|nr:hypothetical protein [Verrucomicrobiota bacterium]